MKSTAMAFLILFLCFARVAICQQVQHLDSRLDGIITEQPGCGERIAMSGFVHAILQQTASANDKNVLYTMHAGPRGDAFAIGLDTGIRYNMTGSTMTRIQSDADFLKSFTYVNNFKVVGLYTVKYDLHVKLNDDGSIQTYVEHPRVVCK